MTNAAISSRELTPQFNIDPLLSKVLQDAERDHQKFQDAFCMLGWGELPDMLKIEIKEDVKAMVEELEGQYSTCDPYVLKRRQRVSYWVTAFQDGICSLHTAIDSLKVTKL